MKTLKQLVFDDWDGEYKPTSDFVYAEAPITLQSKAFVVDMLKPSIGDIGNFQSFCPIDKLRDLNAIMSPRKIVDFVNSIHGVQEPKSDVNVVITVTMAHVTNKTDTFYVPVDRLYEVIDWLIDHDELKWSGGSGHLLMEYVNTFAFTRKFDEFNVSHTVSVTTLPEYENSKIYKHATL